MVTDPKVFTVKTDGKVYRKAQEVAADLGFSISSLVNAFLKDFTRKKTVHFTLVTENGYTPAQEEEMLKDMRESDEEIASGKARLYTSVDDMMADLLADDISPPLHKKVQKGLQKVSKRSARSRHPRSHRPVAIR